jgi:hypothetical protein
VRLPNLLYSPLCFIALSATAREQTIRRHEHAIHDSGQIRENAGPPPKELMEAITKLGEESAKAGVLLETGGLLPSATGA